MSEDYLDPLEKEALEQYFKICLSIYNRLEAEGKLDETIEELELLKGREIRSE
jgi:hypothetical protein